MKNLFKFIFIIMMVILISGCAGVKWSPGSKTTSTRVSDKYCEGIEYMGLYGGGAYGINKYFARIRNNTVSSRVVTIRYKSHDVPGKAYTRNKIINSGKIEDIELGVYTNKPYAIKIIKCE